MKKSENQIKIKNPKNLINLIKLYETNSMKNQMKKSKIKSKWKNWKIKWKNEKIKSKSKIQKSKNPKIQKSKNPKSHGAAASTFPISVVVYVTDMNISTSKTHQFLQALVVRMGWCHRPQWRLHHRPRHRQRRGRQGHHRRQRRAPRQRRFHRLLRCRRWRRPTTVSGRSAAAEAATSRQGTGTRQVPTVSWKQIGIQSVVIQFQSFQLSIQLISNVLVMIHSLLILIWFKIIWLIWYKLDSFKNNWIDLVKSVSLINLIESNHSNSFNSLITYNSE